MPMAGQVKPPVVERLSDRIAIGVLTSIYPPELVDRVVAESGRTQQRRQRRHVALEPIRWLPAVVEEGERSARSTGADLPNPGPCQRFSRGRGLGGARGGSRAMSRRG
jgi:hypothetical protein